jgi:acyl carrier protein
MHEIETQLQDIIQAKMRRRPSVDESFAELDIDSLAMAEIVFEIESTFDVRTDDEVLDISNIQELAAYIDRLRAKA